MLYFLNLLPPGKGFQMSVKKKIKKTGKILLYSLGGLLLILCLLFLFINLPVGKRLVKNKIESYLGRKLHTSVTIGSVNYRLPKWVQLHEICIKDQRNDTLLYCEKISADLDMLKLIGGNTDIKKLGFTNTILNISRGENDNAFNYQFVVDAFSPKQTTAPVVKDTAALNLVLKRLQINRMAVRYDDKKNGMAFTAGIKELDTEIDQFQPDKTNFALRNFTAAGLSFFMRTYKEPVTETALTTNTVPGSPGGFNIIAAAFDLRDVQVNIQNTVTGMFYANDVKHLALKNTGFSLAQSTASCDLLLLDSSRVQFTNPLSSIKKGSSQQNAVAVAVPWQITARAVSLASNEFRYDDENLARTEGFDFGHFNLHNLSAGFSAFQYTNASTSASVQQLSFKDTSGFKLDTMHADFQMTSRGISAKALYIKTPQSVLQNEVNISYTQVSDLKENPRNSIVSAVLHNTIIAFNDLYLLVPSLKKSFPPDQFAGQMVYLNTELQGNLAKVNLPFLQLGGLSGSRLNAHGTLYNLSDAKTFAYDLHIDNSSIRKQDILKFVPPENRASLAQLPDIIMLTGQITGNQNNLVADVNSSGTDLIMNGVFTFRNMTNPEKLEYDFAVLNGSFNRNTVLGFIPAGTLPPQINLPQHYQVKGTLSGNVNRIIADITLNDNYGSIKIKGTVNGIQTPETVNYDLDISPQNYQIGKLTGQEAMLETLTGTITAKGTGFNPKTMQAVVTASVKQMQYKQYNYRNAAFSARLNKGIIQSEGYINDSSLNMQYHIIADVRNNYPVINGSINIDTAQLQRLNLYPDVLNFSLHANIQANNLRPRNLDIHTVIDDIRMQTGNSFYTLDSVLLLATSSAGKDDITFTSPFFSFNANGAFDYDKIPGAVVQYINRYYQIPGVIVPGNLDGQQIVFHGVINKHPLLTGIIPGLDAYDTVRFKGNFASADTDSALNFEVSVPYLSYNGNTVRNAQAQINSRNERISYNAVFDTLNYGSNIFYGTRLNGSAARDSLLLSVRTQDNKQKDWFGIRASLYAKDNNYRFSLKDSLLLNYEQWTVASDNYISYSPNGLIVHHFLVTSDTAKILISSRQELANSPVDLTIDNFNLKSISALISRDSLFVSGIMDAKMEVNDLNKKLPAFTGNLTVTGMTMMQQPLGTVSLFAEKQSENTIAASVLLNGNGNDIEVKGNYYLNNELQEFEATGAIRKLNIAALEGFTGGALNSATGNVHGTITANGKFADPRWKGILNFDTTKFTVAQLGTSFKIDNQEIILNYPAITLGNFVIRDSLNHPMNINGSVSMSPEKDWMFNLGIKTSDFILLNAPKKANSEVYGFAAADADIYITGNTAAPDIQGDLFINDKSDLTLVIPERSYGKDEGKTIVRFIDRDTFEINPPVMAFVPEKEIRPDFAQFLNYNLNIEIRKNAALTIIIDPVTGDEIKVQGDAQLTAGVDPGGHLILAGNYELNNGYYLFNYQFLRRKFMLEKGSSIVFAGEPMKARLNVTAAYTVNTSAKDMLGNETGTVDPVLANSFNQKQPFKVVLYLTGSISKPTIKFDIQLPEDNALMGSDLRTTIENKLAQIRGDESATNKQVFSLLLLGRFTGEQSSDFFKGNGNDFNDIARQSVSRFLSSALNEIAGNLLKGVDIDLNLNSYRDYSNGGNEQRTDLNVALSKTFLDDKLTVSVGRNFDVQGQNAGTKTNTSFIPDVTVGYKLTKDGKYLLRAYRKNQFEVVMDGYVVETGLGFIVTLDYDRFRELFGKKNKK